MMVLPRIELILTLFIAHLFVLLLLLFVWWFVRHSQRKHHEHMALKRIKDIPSSKDPCLVKDEKMQKTTIKENKNFGKVAQEKVEKDLQVIRGHVAPTFHHRTKAKTLSVTKEQREEYLKASIEGIRSQNQEQFEDNLQQIKKSIKRKGYRAPNQKEFQYQLDEINQKLAELDPSADVVEGTLKGKKRYNKHSDNVHEKWKESVASDFENLYKLTAKGAKKKSFFQRERPHFIAMHKREVEEKALKLVQKIARRIEADHPIPLSELDWIEAGLHDVHRDIWGK